MTEHQRQLFSNLLDINWELNKVNYNKIVKTALANEYHRVSKELEEDMGTVKYLEFLKIGKEMFAPIPESKA